MNSKSKRWANVTFSTNGRTSTPKETYEVRVRSNDIDMDGVIKAFKQHLAKHLDTYTKEDLISHKHCMTKGANDTTYGQISHIKTHYAFQYQISRVEITHGVAA